MFRPAREMPREMPLGEVGHRIGTVLLVPAEAGKRGDLALDRIVAAPVETRRRLGRGPGAVEKPHHPVRQHVGEGDKRAVALVAQPVAGIFRHVERQRPVRPEQAEEAVRQPRRVPVCGRGEGTDRRGREGKLGLLPQPHRILRGAAAFSETRGIAEPRLDDAKRMEQVEFLRLAGELGEMPQIIRPRPASGLHRAISPRCCVLRTVSVKLLMVTYLRKNLSSTAPSR